MKESNAESQVSEGQWNICKQNANLITELLRLTLHQLENEEQNGQIV